MRIRQKQPEKLSEASGENVREVVREAGQTGRQTARQELLGQASERQVARFLSRDARLPVRVII